MCPPICIHKDVQHKLVIVYATQWSCGVGIFLCDECIEQAKTCNYGIGHIEDGKIVTDAIASR